MNTLKKIVENYLLNFNQKYMFIDKETKYTKKLILKKIEFYKEILSKNWENKSNKGVAILLDRDIDYLCIIFAAWMSDGFYLPLSLEMPKDNINYQIKDSGVSLIVLKKKGKIIFKKIRYKKNKLINKNNDNIAYIIFTSGSTGKKKGVCISKSGLISYYRAIKNEFKNKRPFKSLVISGELTFDITLADFIFALVFKTSIALTDKSKNLLSLIDMVDTYKIEAMYLVPSALNKLLEISNRLGKNHLLSIKHINLGGERLSPSLLLKTKKKFKNICLYNFYGPTEFTINSLCHKVVLNKNYSDVPIGKPLKGVKVYIKKDKSTNNTGELYLRGKQIMLGYVNFKNTYQIIKGKKYYPTGDIVKLNKLKEFEYIGRTKEYIKLDGFRINLGRIENIILKHIKISAKTTIIDSKIVLFIEGELNNKKQISVKLHRIYKNYLEFYERPFQVKFLRKFSYLESGKIDVKKMMGKN